MENVTYHIFDPLPVLSMYRYLNFVTIMPKYFWDSYKFVWLSRRHSLNLIVESRFFFQIYQYRQNVSYAAV